MDGVEHCRVWGRCLVSLRLEHGEPLWSCVETAGVLAGGCAEAHSGRSQSASVPRRAQRREAQ